MANTFDNRNLTMLTDFYELTMANGYFENGMKDTVACFDMFFRRVPSGGGFAVLAGIEQLVKYIENISFSKEDIEYINSKGIFSDAFINYLADFNFTCDIWAIPEGTPVFPYEPIVTVKGPIIEAQFIETMLLLTVNHQSLIATKANRIARAAGERSVFEFGSRRAQGYDGAVYGARAAYIGGSTGTACTISDQSMGIPALGTMAHSWVQAFETEIDAFRKYASLYPDNCTLLVDTYDTLKSGIPNAIKTFDEVLKPIGHRPAGIRIDSGDITYLSKKARKMLHAAGYPDCKICASNSLDEYIIRDMIIQGACVDIFGVGERLITSSDEPVFGGVYKLAALESDGKMIPKIKISENVAKITTPCHKKVYRLFDLDTNKAIADVVTLFDEKINENEPYEIFDPEHTWKRKIITDFKAVVLQRQIFKNGIKCAVLPTINEIKEYCIDQTGMLWDEVKRFENPHKYYVDLSLKLWTEKNELLKQTSSE